MGACFGRGDDAARRLRDAGESVFDDTPCPLALKEPKNGEYGLTIVGLVAPELIFFTDGREDLNQAGPFVIHSKTRWSGTRLITKWSTSELMGVSFKGQWVRSVSADGRESTLEVHADSSPRRHSDASLKFRKK
jgi:hypothetical protein